jgi:hypothetical protein
MRSVIDETTPRINAADRIQRHARMDQGMRNGALDWAEWWQVAGGRQGSGARGAHGPSVRDLR